MKLALKLNIGNYQTLDIETNEYDTEHECYIEILIFLRHWTEYTETAKKLLAHIENIT